MPWQYHLCISESTANRHPSSEMSRRNQVPIRHTPGSHVDIFAGNKVDLSSVPKALHIDFKGNPLFSSLHLSWLLRKKLDGAATIACVALALLFLRWGGNIYIWTSVVPCRLDCSRVEA
ncbi:hypothetical protein Pyn_02800 [Prunus yedoensis var. nudiflora]|uniref:Uncharacterized protein n=1 Tax=Prunus yedoensis var. nudiflora TaxID=2094558 RepID=A0A314V101_PRUYE|nr:hypothetical protein Pyn_02800 [Prunus yedoensis var. nudiflora]